MRPRTAKAIAQVCAIAAVVMLIYFTIMVITGCAPKPALPPAPATPNTTSGLTDAAAGLLEAATPSDPTEAAATQSLWPFTWVGALCLLAGVVWVILFRQPLVLILGAVIAAVPFIVLYTSKAFLIPVAIGVAAIGLITLGAAAGRWLGWWDWSKKTDERAQYLTNMMAQGKVPAQDQLMTGEVARALNWVGRPGFSPTAAELPHHDDNPLPVTITPTPPSREPPK